MKLYDSSDSKQVKQLHLIEKQKSTYENKNYSLYLLSTYFAE